MTRSTTVSLPKIRSVFGYFILSDRPAARTIAAILPVSLMGI